ncbi:MAG: biotin--[acetyl-CoA-carboxylase] ligase [Actinobacteria bacterium]|nr:biotin--[acetyl-CoA-carboxylase] ligase [Actinomycetota bacterium]
MTKILNFSSSCMQITVHTPTVLVVGNELHRAALRQSELHAELSPYWRVSVVDVTGSTQVDLAESIRAHTAVDGDVLVANYQSAGKGRLDREFIAAPSSALLFSLYKKVMRPRDEWNFIALLTALSISEALVGLNNKVNLSIKWPNDILINEKKIAGLLCQADNDGVIVGVGLNVDMSKDELPVVTASSLYLENFLQLDRNEILKRILKAFEENFQKWSTHGSAPFVSKYEDLCSSLHRDIQIIWPAGDPAAAVATGISPLGELILNDGTLVNSADVLHLR